MHIHLIHFLTNTIFHHKKIKKENGVTVFKNVLQVMVHIPSSMACSLCQKKTFSHLRFTGPTSKDIVRIK